MIITLDNYLNIINFVDSIRNLEKQYCDTLEKGNLTRTRLNNIMSVQQDL